MDVGKRRVGTESQGPSTQRPEEEQVQENKEASHIEGRNTKRKDIMEDKKIKCFKKDGVNDQLSELLKAK